MNWNFEICLQNISPFLDENTKVIRKDYQLYHCCLEIISIDLTMIALASKAQCDYALSTSLLRAYYILRLSESIFFSIFSFNVMTINQRLIGLNLIFAYPLMFLVLYTRSVCVKPKTTS